MLYHTLVWQLSNDWLGASWYHHDIHQYLLHLWRIIIVKYFFAQSLVFSNSTWPHFFGLNVLRKNANKNCFHNQHMAASRHSFSASFLSWLLILPTGNVHPSVKQTRQRHCNHWNFHHLRSSVVYFLALFLKYLTCPEDFIGLPRPLKLILQFLHQVFTN